MLQVSVPKKKKGRMESQGISKEDYIKRMTMGSQGSEETDGPDNWLMYVGVNSLRPEEEWHDSHGFGFVFKKNVVQKVSQEVFDYLKSFRGFKVIRKVNPVLLDFPKVKKK